ncbi:endonuclease III [Methanomethylovorans sp.]|uniref:endonuclease III domain-containing protein n=1 Tax=Methanomethylovorans sp. TaxID=2758717 RepID=UPI000AD7015C|nr:endonuclease III [Methanomethylovorans sp.]
MLASEVISRLRCIYTTGFFDRIDDPFYVLISTVLSQRTRDDITIPATEKLFKVYGSAAAMAGADPEDIEELIKDVGFYRVKSRRIIEISSILLEEYGGKVPDNIEDLLKLPGVGRKTANCVLTYAFHKDVIAVDTHVHRISNRLGLVTTHTPEETEVGLERVVPKELWQYVNELLVRFGQDICRPISPKCDVCMLEDICPSRVIRVK